jgi:hypothetical protein
VLANDSNLSIHNPVLVYSFLAMYGVLTIVVLAYVHAKFRFATRTLTMLRTEWDSADTRHAGFVGRAQEQISKLSVPAPAGPSASAKPAIGFEVRNQVVAMGKKGFSSVEIARVCNLPEGEVEVLLGMARLQR